ncbi:DUF4124 domain-containing protein [Photobacterium sp. TY1-4]|uniref:DUF4124 domain-containing protein n=1 Tax=Photobacterium sp. TY1-4 TaxID=2899122 RepID=UPI0021C1628D|nr:DUF4124 domain-containing protein [Photobacterium sp. TY1-4]UXI01197.1 DUF4124 domain-containing protein [Photobacterium sp. TY1-4]
MKAITATMLLCLSASLSATSVYTWQDTQGVTHFSDLPQPGATPLLLDPPATLTLSQPAPTTPPAQPEPATLPPLLLTLDSPADQQTLRDNRGIIAVTLSANRPLAQDEQVLVLLDGAPYAAPQATLTWQLHNIDRGSHRLRAQVLKDGKVIASSQDITVFLHRASVRQQTTPGPEPK